jgi:hypothetical protein
MKIIERIKKERYILNFIQRMLDESALKIERESDAGVMLELLLAPLKYMLNQKPRYSTPLTHSIEAGGIIRGNRNLIHSRTQTVREAEKKRTKVRMRESQEIKVKQIDLITTTITDRGTRMVGLKVGPALNMLSHGLQVKNILVQQVGLVQR